MEGERKLSNCFFLLFSFIHLFLEDVPLKTLCCCSLSCSESPCAESVSLSTGTCAFLIYLERYHGIIEVSGYLLAKREQLSDALQPSSSCCITIQPGAGEKQLK